MVHNWYTNSGLSGGTYGDNSLIFQEKFPFHGWLSIPFGSTNNIKGACSKA